MIGSGGQRSARTAYFLNPFLIINRNIKTIGSLILKEYKHQSGEQQGKEEIEKLFHG